MTSHKAVVLRAGGQPVHRILADQLPRLVDQVLTRLVADIPLYAQLPREELQGDIRQITERTLRAFTETFRTGAVPTAEAMTPLRESAARRAEEGVPLEALLAAYHLGAKICADFVADAFQPDELPDALELNRLILDFLQLVTATVASSYFEERQTIAGEDQATRQTLLAALLDGGPAAEIAHRAGLRLPGSYLVLGLAFGAHPDERQPGVDTDIVTRRKLRRLRVELDRGPGGPAMAALSPDDGIALLDGTTGLDLAALRTRMSKSAGVQVTLTATKASPEEVPAAVTLVRDLLVVARVHRQEAGVYGLEDLLLEYQLSRPGPARDRLAEYLAPLVDRPELLRTLRTHLANGRNRRQTATELHLHPNTVDYRLRQIARLTDLDPSRPEQLPRLVAALTAHDAG